MSVLHELGRDMAKQLSFYFEWCFARRDAGAIADSEDVGVHGDGGLGKRDIKDDIGGLASDAWKILQLDAIGRDLTSVSLNELTARLDDMLGLALVEPDCHYIFLEPRLTQGKNGLRSIGLGEQFAGRHVDRFIGGLGGKHHRHKQLKRGGILELRLRVRVCHLKPAKDFGALGRVHFKPVSRFLGTGLAQVPFVAQVLRLGIRCMAPRLALFDQNDERIAWRAGAKLHAS